ncbi:HAD-IA family hydrolase [Pseudoalteromonas xiamenensis]|uniref:HAD-IA family hydrolase n=1 Tax=Pseudoalteromonas xiamenensis TaxID=882626 RepID=A0A975DHJ1_9GAMM|nr:HAD-IA family hydrolase [Pseudoalteromonas xiamenensis]QTH71805.1 HAD-IA family hydrolase [Pseudoalteromonas xiamenensis]
MTRKLVIFDWDGTIMDSIDKIVNSLQLAASSCGVDVPNAEQAKSIIGLSLDIAVQTLFPNHESKWQALSEAYKHQFKYLDSTPTPLFENVEQVLAALKKSGVMLAVATGKSRAGLDRMMEQSGLGHLFSTSRTADEAQSKPHPQMLHDILAELNIEAADAVMVGDTIIDMELAANANIAAIGVTMGVDKRERLASKHPIAVVDNYLELATVLGLEHIETKLA